MDQQFNEDEYAIELADYYVHGYENVVGVSAKTAQRINMLRGQIEYVAHTLGLMSNEKEVSYHKVKN